MHFAHHESDRLFRFAAIGGCRGAGGEAMNKKVPPPRREIRGGYLFYF